MTFGLSSPRRVNYDVFLSFRGPDTRKNIISHLYKELVRQGIQTFKDDRTLELGDCVPKRLREAINTSRFAIVVISQTYGTSSWCLEELRMIMELELDEKIAVIPIFYDVDISDVRKHRGSFYLVPHHPKSRPKIPSWNEALKRIAETQGTDSRRYDPDTNADEATMIEGVVEHVSNTLLSTLPMDLGDIVGMKAHIHQIEHLLDMAFTTKEVRMVGIWGMVGVGKTAIAKNLYEKHKHHFKNHRYFMEKVSSLEKNPLFLQKQLLSNILGNKDLKALNLGQGAPCIKSRLRSLKSLIVIDDVDDVKQLDALAKEASWFGPGSRIIITTRDKSLLNSSCPVYKVECFKDDKALEIFQWIAFQGAEPPIAYNDLCVRISQLAQGLPRALEHFGTYLRGKSLVEWRDALRSFRETPLEETMVDLKSSYDGLDELGKTAFRHVACLFNGEPERRVRKLIGQGKAGIGVLMEKSLIKVSADRRITMHRLLEQMGKYIVRQESNNNPSQQRILWHHDDILQVLDTPNTSKHLIEGVELDVCELRAGVHINWDDFKPMHNLRFLKIYISNHSGGLQPWKEYMTLENKFNIHKLRLLHWDAYPFTTLPTGISPDCLVEVKLCYSKIKTLWNGTPKLVNLMKLDLTGSKDLAKLPNLKEAKCLEELILKGCSSLERIPHSICKLSKLQKLDVSNCDGLEKLKISISESKDTTSMCLRSVHMFFFGTEPFVRNTQGCSLTDPSIRGNLQIYLKVLEGSAEHLSFVSENGGSHEVELKSPPYGFKSLNIMRFEWSDKGSYFKCDSFSRFPWLQELNLVNLNIQKIPDDIDQMQVLQKLDLSGNMFKSLPTTMIRLTKLKHLTLSNCRSLEELPGLCQVESLTLSDCTNLRTLVKKDQGTYSLLELWLDNCKKIESLPNELKHFTKLTYLDLSRQDFKIISSKMVGDLTSLVTLSLNYCNNLVSLSGLPLSLKCLNAHGCKSLKTYSLQAAHSINHLDLSPCPNGKDYSTTFTRFPAGRRSKEVPACACPCFQETTTRSKDKHATCSHLSIFLGRLKSWLWDFFLCILAVVLGIFLAVITDHVIATTLLMTIFMYLRL